MKFKSIAAVAALVLAASGASANDVTQDITVTGGTTFYGAVHTDNQSFTDVLTFLVSGGIYASGVYANLSLVTVGSGAANIDFLSATLNGLPVALSPQGFIETGVLGDTALSGPLVLTITGNSFAEGSTFASYSGTLNVSPVPEPQGYALALAGLAALAWVRRQRRA
jgi:MYXO-CTERM domain-containing protein